MVEVYDRQDRFLGAGYINPNSLIAVRLLTREKERIDSDFFRRRILAAIEYRRRFALDFDSCRLIYSEGDYIPGLIADKYGDCLAVQFLTLGIEKHKDLILNLLDEILSPSAIILRNDSRSRILEGLGLEKRIVKGSLNILPIIKECGVLIEVDPMSGQKTGFFLDQRENRLALSRMCSGGKGLDLFCYTGAWGLQLAVKGMQVFFVDDSETALMQAKKNSALNRIESNCVFVKTEAFDFLKKEVESGNSYEIVVIDPPAFVKSRSKIKEALKGYRDLNSMAMRLVRKGGILATSSCSYHIERTTFLEMLRNAARDCKKSARLLEYRSQSRDHPVLLPVPETEYLKCAFIEL